MPIDGGARAVRHGGSAAVVCTAPTTGGGLPSLHASFARSVGPRIRRLSELGPACPPSGPATLPHSAPELSPVTLVVRLPIPGYWSSSEVATVQAGPLAIMSSKLGGEGRNGERSRTPSEPTAPASLPPLSAQSSAGLASRPRKGDDGPELSAGGSTSKSSVVSGTVDPRASLGRRERKLVMKLDTLARGLDGGD